MGPHDRATLQLDFTSERSFIHCPTAWQGQQVSTMQPCAPPDAKDSTSTSTLAMLGQARRDHDGLTISVREGKREMTLVCTEQGQTLACSLDDGDGSVFGFVGDRPRNVTFRL